MARSSWKGPFVDGYLLKKADAVQTSGRKDVIKTWSRRSTILPQFVGLTFGVHNGQKHVPVSVSEEMVGMKLGDKWDSDPRVKAAFHSADLLIGIVLIALVGFYIWHRVSGLKRHP